MLPHLPGFRLTEEIHRSPRTQVYRGYREADRHAFIIKTLNPENLDMGGILRLRREHRILSALQTPGIGWIQGLDAWRNREALVFEDCGAEPLSEQLTPGLAMPLDVFFRLAIACARLLTHVHQHAIHKDLTPRNILWNPKTDAVRFIGYGHASEFMREPQVIRHPKLPRESLPYVSPEQTGRLNRGLDYRTDFYFLGVTFYRLLTGQLPFTATDPFDWIHCHLTQAAVPPQTLNPEIPEPLSELVLKLLAKSPEDRYQSARGLFWDLTKCQRHWQETGTIPKFRLASRDVAAQFHIPRRLYGREAESQRIATAFQAAAAGKPGFVLISGPAGIGKTALVNDLLTRIVDVNGYFLRGKFDQFRSDLPYAAFSQALGGLVEQLLTEPEERLAHWKSAIAEALGPNGRIATDLVPHLVRILGPQPPVAPLNPTEEQNRFLATVQSLLGVFARPEHPVVLFLDDLHWSDVPTLRLLQSLLDSQGRSGLLLIGATREDELDDAHPLSLILAEMATTREVERLTLAPLSEETLNRFVADALQTEPSETRPLGAVLHRKTAGNPFFARELLRTLHQDGLLTFDSAAGHWTWDMEGVIQAPISEDVAAFMLSRLQRLPAETQALLKLAACLGSGFDLGMLGVLAAQAPSAVAAAIWPAITEGVIVPQNEGYVVLPGGELEGTPSEVHCQFLHDRVRQAAYALIPDAERERTHLHIGRTLRHRASDADRLSSAAEIARQLNVGRALIADPAERLDLARLNFAAACKAKEAAAYQPAFDYLSVARELLPASAWQEHFDLAFDIGKLYAACAHLCGEFALADACCEELLSRCRTPLAKAEIHSMIAAQHAFSSQMDAAIAEGIRALSLLGIPLSANPSMASVGLELMRSKAAQGLRKAADLENAKPISDPATRLAMKILVDFVVPSYLSGNSTLFAATALKQATLSLRHGNGVESASAYISYAVLLAGLGDLAGAYDFGRLALRLSDAYEAVDSQCRTLVLYALFAHSWSQPWTTLSGWFKASIEAGMKSGDFLFMAYACGYVNLWDPQVDLETALEESRKYLALCKQTRYQNALDAASLAHQYWLCLRGDTEGPLSLSTPDFDEAACLERMTRAGYTSGIAIYHLFKLQLACFHEDAEPAWRSLQQADGAIQALAGSPYMVDYTTYAFQAAVMMAAKSGKLSGQARRRLGKCHRRMQAWARHCPQNFGHHERLMRAQRAALLGKTKQAPALFEQAIAAARDSGFLRDEARACEAAARFYLSQGLEHASRAYLDAARDAYRRWGALAKVRDLDPRHGLLASGNPAAGPAATVGDKPLHLLQLGQVPELVSSGMLDLATVWKATQAISSEVILERLLATLIATVKETAGAQRAVLLLNAGDASTPRLVLQAESQEDGTLNILQGEALQDDSQVPVTLIRYVARSQTHVLLPDAARTGAYSRDPYIQAQQSKSMLVLPIVNQGNLLGVLSLENPLLRDAFTPDRLAVLQILAGQAAIALHNVQTAERTAYLEAERQIKDSYARELEARVEARTRELKQAYDQLVELDHLKANFLSVVSHELRTPLTSIQGYSEFLEDRLSGDLTDGQAEYVRQIQQGTQHLCRLVDDLLDFARIEAGSLKITRSRIDLSRPILAAVESLSPALQDRRLAVQTRLLPEPVWAHVDPGRITQVLLNLLGNALKFTPAGGQVSVTLSRLPSEVRIEVRDTGVGIDAEHLPRLFQKFYQVDSSTTREQGGTGLGLSIAQSIVEAHGGTIGVESVPGQGSTFWFTLPL